MYQCDKRQALLTAFLVCVIAIPAGAQTIWHVDDDACPGPGSGTVVDPFCLIQDAMVAAANGDEILVAPGTYFEEVNFLGKAVTLRSAGGVAVTTIESGIGFRAVTCQNGEGADSILSGFTLTGASGAAMSGGMTIFQASPTVMNCVFKNSSWPSGGGLGIFGGDPSISNCIFSDNTSSFGGGGVFSGSGSNATLSYCTFQRNTSDSAGGGMAISTGSPLIMECTFNFNTTSNDGGGLRIATNSQAIVTNCSFTGNMAVGSGGGICSFNGSSPIIRACIFTSNVSAGGSGGGGMCVSQGAPQIIGSTFLNNIADRGGGLTSNSATSYIVNCRFEGNVADRWGGGLNDEASTSTIVNCVMIGNDALSGGGVSTLSGNSQYFNCTIYGNTATEGGGAWNSSTANPSFTSVILWGNGPDQIFNDGLIPSVNSCDIQGGFVGGGFDNIDADPLFVDAASGDFHLRIDSPCIDTGNFGLLPPDTADLDDDGFVFEKIPFDFDGNSRSINNFATDIGAFESDQCDADTDASGDVNVTDLLALLAAWGPCPSPCPEDINIDGSVNVTDLLALLAAWGACP